MAVKVTNISGNVQCYNYIYSGRPYTFLLDPTMSPCLNPPPALIQDFSLCTRIHVIGYIFRRNNWINYMQVRLYAKSTLYIKYEKFGLARKKM